MYLVSYYTELPCNDAGYPDEWRYNVAFAKSNDNVTVAVVCFSFYPAVRHCIF